MTVLGRINTKTSDRPAENAIYHQICSVQDRKSDSTKFCGQEEVSKVPPPKKRREDRAIEQRKSLSKKHFGAKPTMRNLYL